MEYKIINKLGILEGEPEGYRIEMNIICWGEDGAPMLDIRKWQPNGRPSRGLCLGEEGLKALKDRIKDVTL